MSKYKMVCGRCGSEEVRADAYAEWNIETQEWEISNVFDKGSVCEGDECQGLETRIIEIAIEE